MAVGVSLFDVVNNLDFSFVLDVVEQALFFCTRCRCRGAGDVLWYSLSMSWSRRCSFVLGVDVVEQAMFFCTRCRCHGAGDVLWYSVSMSWSRRCSLVLGVDVMEQAMLYSTVASFGSLLHFGYLSTLARDAVTIRPWLDTQLE